MLLPDQIVQVLRASLDAHGKQTINGHGPHGPVQGGISVERDRLLWLTPVFD
jgi:hypothetical protein